MLRATGSIEGAEQFWLRIDFKKSFGKKLACCGFGKRERQLLINKVAFPDLNFIEVDAALKAGSKLWQLYQLASGRASIARDSSDNTNLQPKVSRLFQYVAQIEVSKTWAASGQQSLKPDGDKPRQGVLANLFDPFRNRAVGLIDWLTRFDRPNDYEEADQSSRDDPTRNHVRCVARFRTSLRKINHETEG